MKFTVFYPKAISKNDLQQMKQSKPEEYVSCSDAMQYSKKKHLCQHRMTVSATCPREPHKVRFAYDQTIAL